MVYNAGPQLGGSCYRWINFCWRGLSGRLMAEARAGACKCETKRRRGSLIRRTFPLIWASVLDGRSRSRSPSRSREGERSVGSWEGPRGSAVRAVPRDAC